MNTYRIEAGDVVMGEYKGESEQEALEAYAKDAGYKSYEDLQEQHPAKVKIKEV